ncbi:hypothetical protein AAF712_015022 [Marasmius tenuissimus]|uniref:Uncharacterized protein n=1 Tax=Marasmius tenuissimus TaxID=585030 RepID=A0ABR2Z9F0_9AGAR
MRGKPRFELQKDLKLVKESLRDSVLGPGVFVSAPSTTTDDPFMNYINYTRHPASAVNVHLVEVGRSERLGGQENGAKELPVEPQEQIYHGSGVISASEDTNPIHALEPNRLKEDVSLSSVTSKTTGSDTTDAPEEGAGSPNRVAGGKAEPEGPVFNRKPAEKEI